jgi:lysophospholipid acyltransferase (LPLAT)-like uncharacterized protein
MDSIDGQRPGPLVGGPSPREQRSRKESSRLTTALFTLIAPLIVLLFRALWASYRFEVVGEERVLQLVKEGKSLILTCWHESVFIMAWYTLRLARMGARVTYLVSPSRDGDLVVRVLDAIGATVVRGSATRSGVKALHGLYRSIRRDNGSPLMLSDGPQGPPLQCKPGSILLSQLSGARILPVGSWPRRAIRLRTWDRLFVPMPGSRVAVVLGEPYTVCEEMSDEVIERERLALQVLLEQLTERAKSESHAG